jgi:hypothetical protein
MSTAAQSARETVPLMPNSVKASNIVPHEIETAPRPTSVSSLGENRTGPEARIIHNRQMAHNDDNNNNIDMYKHNENEKKNNKK